MTVTPPTMEESNKRSAFRESRSRSVSMSRERSMSPLSMPKIQEQHEEETFNYSRPSLSLTLKKQQADEVETPRITKSDILYDKLGLPISPREDDVTVMHGSSEFMLVLYPEDEEKKVDDTTRKDLGITILFNWKRIFVAILFFTYELKLREFAIKSYESSTSIFK